MEAKGPVEQQFNEVKKAGILPTRPLNARMRQGHERVMQRKAGESDEKKISLLDRVIQTR